MRPWPSADRHGRGTVGCMQVLIEPTTSVDAAVARIGAAAGRIQLIPLGAAGRARAEQIAARLAEQGLHPTVLRPLPDDVDLTGAARSLVRVQ